MGVQRNDILWKGVLEDFFAEFLQLIFDNANDIFDFSKRFRFLDNALAEMFPEQDLKHPKRIDKLAEVYTRSGRKEWILVHVEVQGYRQPIFAERIFTYYYRLRDKYKMPVTCIVVYLGNSGGANASFYESECLGTKLRLDFNTYYVGEQDEKRLRESENPFATVVLTALIALKHKHNIQDLFNSKMILARNLLQSGIEKEKTRKLINFIKLYIHFEENELNYKFERNIKLLTAKNSETMGILEQVRELLKEQVRNEGMLEGKLKGMREGELKGIREGKREGERVGELKAKTSIAKKLKSLGISTVLITKSTGLSSKQIATL